GRGCWGGAWDGEEGGGGRAGGRQTDEGHGAPSNHRQSPSSHKPRRLSAARGAVRDLMLHTNPKWSARDAVVARRSAATGLLLPMVVRSSYSSFSRFSSILPSCHPRPRMPPSS